MTKNIRKLLKVQNDVNFDILARDYNNDILDSTAFYNILKKEYKFDKETDINIKNKLKIEDKKVKDNKKISIIIPTYNRKKQLKECIDSILKQTYSNFEIIVVDDCSKDNTEEFIKETYKDDRIKCFKNSKNSGAGVSRKNGYSKCTGEYIIFCDDDDYYIDNNFFNIAINIFKDNKISLICSNSYVKYEKENKYILNKLNFENMIPAKTYLEKFQFEYMKPNSTFSTIFRKSILEEGKFENMFMVNDSSIYMRALINGGNVYVNQNIIGIYRIHAQNITFNISADFLIGNLEEKKYIYNKIMQKKIIINPEKWFKKQVFLTVKYFLNGTNPSEDSKNEVLNWVKKNVRNSSMIILKIKIYKIELEIKKIIKSLIRRK